MSAQQGSRNMGSRVGSYAQCRDDATAASELVENAMKSAILNHNVETMFDSAFKKVFISVIFSLGLELENFCVFDTLDNKDEENR